MPNFADDLSLTCSCGRDQSECLGNEHLTQFMECLVVSWARAEHAKPSASRLLATTCRLPRGPSPYNFQTTLPHPPPHCTHIEISPTHAILSIPQPHGNTSWRKPARMKQVKGSPNFCESTQSGTSDLPRHSLHFVDRWTYPAFKMLSGISSSPSRPMTPASTSTPCTSGRPWSTIPTMPRSTMKISIPP